VDPYLAQRVINVCHRVVTVVVDLFDASVPLITSHEREALAAGRPSPYCEWMRSDMPQSRNRLWCRRVGAGPAHLVVDGHFDRAPLSPQCCNAELMALLTSAKGYRRLRHADRDNQLRVRRLPCSKRSISSRHDYAPHLFVRRARQRSLDRPRRGTLNASNPDVGRSPHWLIRHWLTKVGILARGARTLRC
jgi:hypothetical protein